MILRMSSPNQTFFEKMLISLHNPKSMRHWASACRVETPLDASASRHECRDGSLERLPRKVNSALETGHGEKSGLIAILFTLSFFSVGPGFEPAAGLRPGVCLNAGWKPGGSTEVLPHELSKQYWG
jgi:hypothetical protein